LNDNIDENYDKSDDKRQSVEENALFEP